MNHFTWSGKEINKFQKILNLKSFYLTFYFFQGISVKKQKLIEQT